MQMKLYLRLAQLCVACHYKHNGTLLVDHFCADPIFHPHGYVLFFAFNLLGFCLCLGTIITIKIIPAINIVINRLIILLLIISCIQSLVSCTIGTFLLRGCTFDKLPRGISLNKENLLSQRFNLDWEFKKGQFTPLFL